MAEPAHIYCVGATKAGTTWLYRALHDHPGCAARAVKELHYWDTFEPAAQARQIASYKARLQGFRDGLAGAKAAGNTKKTGNMTRRVRDMEELLAVLGGDRTGNEAYRSFVLRGANDRASLDITPSYALQSVKRMREMVAITPSSKFVYLIRDPLARLWSHIRMQAERQLGPEKDITEKSNAMLWRVLNGKNDQNVTSRGDYIGSANRLSQAIPADRLHFEFMENMTMPGGLRDIYSFLGLAQREPTRKGKIHIGRRAEMRDNLREQALAFLKEQYEWAARTMGPLPELWQQNLVRASQ